MDNDNYDYYLDDTLFEFDLENKYHIKEIKNLENKIYKNDIELSYCYMTVFICIFLGIMIV